MAEDYVVAIDGFEATRTLNDIPKNMLRSAQQAVNRTADRASTASRREIARQVAFTPSYLTGTDSSGRQRLGVVKRASSGDLEAVISARQRPTSLARFVVGSPSVGQAGVSVQVAPGFARYMRRAFVIRLPAGRGDVETKNNLGLAIRLRPSEVIHNKRVMVRVRGNLYLLYGPSVSQVFDAVRGEIAPEAQDFLGAEFFRLMGLDL